MLAAGRAYDLNPIPGVTRDEFMAAGVLHDVPEDCPEYPLSYILEQFGEVIHRIVDGVTRRQDVVVRGNLVSKGETYADFILRAWRDIGSRALKLEDVTINLGRINTLPESERSIKRRYDKALLVRQGVAGTQH